MTTEVQIPAQEAQQIGTQFVFDLIERTQQRRSLSVTMIVALQKLARGLPATPGGDRPQPEVVEIANALLYKYQTHPKKLLRSVLARKAFQQIGSGNGSSGASTGFWQSQTHTGSSQQGGQDEVWRSQGYRFNPKTGQPL